MCNSRLLRRHAVGAGGQGVGFNSIRRDHRTIQRVQDSNPLEIKSNDRDRAPPWLDRDWP
jgi:hypothetical protein